MRADAEMLAVRAHVMGRVEANFAKMSAAQAESIARTAPTTVKAVMRAFPAMTEVQKATLEYGNAKCCEYVVQLTDNARADMRKLIVDYQEQVALGGTAAPHESLQTRLLDRFGTLNRDWRRIAVTEAGNNALNGMIATLPYGTKVMRIEQYRSACSFCRKWHEAVFEVVDPANPKKDGKTQIWIGKTNIGRSNSPRKKSGAGLVDRTEAEMYWVTVDLFHPNCRGRWVVVPGFSGGGTELRKSKPWGEKEKSEHPRNPKGEFSKVGEKAIIQKMDYMGQRPGLFQLQPILITELSGEEFGTGLTKQQLAKAADLLLFSIQHGAGLFNEDTKWTLRVNRKDRGKMGDNAAQTAAESKAVAGIDRLARHAVVAERHADTQHKNPDVQAILRMYAPVSIRGTIYRAKLTVQDYKGGDKRHLHALSAVEIENAPLGTLLPYSGAEALQAAQPTTVRMLSIAKLMRGASMENGTPFIASPSPGKLPASLDR